MNHRDYDAYQAMQDRAETSFSREWRQNQRPPAFPWGLTIAGIVVTVGVLVMFKLAVG